MWRVLDFGTAERDGGIRVTRAGYRTVTYERDGAQLTIDVEPGPSRLGVYALSIARWEKPERRPIGDDERRTILADVTSALDALKVPHEVLWD